MIRRFLLLFAAVLAFTGVAPAAVVSKKAPAATPAAVRRATPVTPPKAEPVRRATPGPVEVFPAREDDSPPMLSAASYIVLDAASGRVLHEVNADQQRPVASTQKLLTSLIVAETGGLDDKVWVEQTDTLAEPSKLYIKEGEVYRRSQLLQILLVKSMNDVARCLARDNAGSQEAFARRMNAKARELGMTNSNFVNPNGLPAPGQYSTARDMARLAMAAYRNNTIRNFVRMRSITFTYADGRTKLFENTNQVLKNFPLCNGMKTGYTEAAGHCLVSSAAHNGREVIAVVLGDSKKIWNDSYQLLSWALSK